MLTPKEAFKRLLSYFKIKVRPHVCYSYKNYYGFRVSEDTGDNFPAFVGGTVFFVNKYTGRVYDGTENKSDLPKPGDQFTFIDIKRMER